VVANLLTSTIEPVFTLIHIHALRARHNKL